MAQDFSSNQPALNWVKNAGISMVKAFGLGQPSGLKMRRLLVDFKDLTPDLQEKVECFQKKLTSLPRADVELMAAKYYAVSLDQSRLLIRAGKKLKR